LDRLNPLVSTLIRVGALEQAAKALLGAIAHEEEDDEEDEEEEEEEEANAKAKTKRETSVPHLSTSTAACDLSILPHALSSTLQFRHLHLVGPTTLNNPQTNTSSSSSNGDDECRQVVSQLLAIPSQSEAVRVLLMLAESIPRLLNNPELPKGSERGREKERGKERENTRGRDGLVPSASGIGQPALEPAVLQMLLELVLQAGSPLVLEAPLLENPNQAARRATTGTTLEACLLRHVTG
jgi:hypothetical protein